MTRTKSMRPGGFVQPQGQTTTRALRLYEQRQRLKKQSIITAALLGLLFVLTGTFAWYSFEQRAFGPAWEDGNHGGRIHHHYDGVGASGTDPSDPNDWHNNDVFAENFGDRDIFVRLRLREFLAIDGNPVSAMGGVGINDPWNWPIFYSMPDNVHERLPGADIWELYDIYGLEWTLGHQDQDLNPKYFIPTFNHTQHRATAIEYVSTTLPLKFQSLDAFRMTEATGQAVDGLAYQRDLHLDIPGMGHAWDFANYGSQTGPGDGTHSWALSAGPTCTAPSFAVIAGSCYDYLIENYIRNDGVIYVVLGNPVRHFAQETLEIYVDLSSSSLVPTPAPIDFYDKTGETLANFSGVMTILNWNNLGRPSGNFWILDNSDGWFYWNGFLPSGEATSLLMDQLFLPTRQQNWEHLIEIEGDFFAPQSINRLYEEGRPIISEAAMEIFAPYLDVISAAEASESIAPLTPYTYHIVLNEASPIQVQNLGEEIELEATLVRTHRRLQGPSIPVEDAEFTWSFDRGIPDEGFVGPLPPINSTILDGRLTIGLHEIFSELRVVIKDTEGRAVRYETIQIR